MRKAVAAAIALLLTAAVFGHRLWRQPVAVAEATPRELAALATVAPFFAEAPVDFAHLRRAADLPFAGGAVIDTNGDGQDEIFVAGGGGQDDGLLVLRGGRFVNVIGSTGLSSRAATYGALSLDLDGDGAPDLAIARADGLHICRNAAAGPFRCERHALDLPPDVVPVAIAAGDVNRDARPDLLVSTFNAAEAAGAALNDPAQATPSVLLLGAPKGKLADGTAAAGLALLRGGLQPLLADLDGDGWPDLVVPETAGRVAVFRNVRGVFAHAATPAGRGFWTGLAAGDYDGDGDMDLFLANVGNTIPVFLLAGPLPDAETPQVDWALLRNDGGFRFTPVGAAAGLEGFELAWGAAFADVNLDGRPDLVVAENYVKWPAHRWDRAYGRLLLQVEDGRFRPVTRAAAAENRSFGQAPLTGDFDGDGRPDIFFVNLEGAPRALLNRSEGARGIAVRFADDARALGARVTLRRAGGRAASAQLTAGGAFLGDPAPMLFFGLGADAAPADVEVVWPDGRRRSFSAVEPGTVLALD